MNKIVPLDKIERKSMNAINHRDEMRHSEDNRNKINECVEAINALIEIFTAAKAKTEEKVATKATAKAS